MVFIPKKSDYQNKIEAPKNYVVYGWQRSYFTHKLTAALDYYGANWTFVAKNADNQEEVRLRSGTHQIPVLHTPENWMIADTTPLLHMLDARFPARRMFPTGPLGILTQIVEEYFDEWIARTTVHWRWNYPENHELLAMDAAYGDKERAEQMILWGSKVCRATGVSSDIQKQAAEDEYFRIMDAVSRQLKQTPFLLGHRPTAVDCIVLAGLRAHFLYDPAPKKALADRYPDVVAWVENTSKDWDGRGDLAPFGDSTEFVQFVLAEMSGAYQAFALGNRDALTAGERAFVINVYGEDVSYLARPYIEQSRQMLGRRIADELDVDQQASLRAHLASYGLESCFD